MEPESVAPSNVLTRSRCCTSTPLTLQNEVSSPRVVRPLRTRFQSIWPEHPHYGSIIGWIVRIQKS